MPDPAFTPVHLLTGFLGSGKTTFLRRLLSSPAMSNTAVLINELGEIGLDHHLIERIDETVVLLRSGCLCCAIRGELAQAIRDLLSKRDRALVPHFDRLVVESTGLADPFPILSTLKADPVLRHHVRAGAVITTIDAINGADQLTHYPESVHQIAVADQLILTKTDLTNPNATAPLLAQIRQINPDAPLTHATDATLDLAALHRPTSGFRAITIPTVADHATGIRSFVVTIDQPIDWTAFGVWLTMLLHRHGDRILRVKGILNLTGEPAPVAIHGVRYLVHTPVHMAAWPDADRRSHVVFIVDGLDPTLIRRSLAAFNSLRTPEPA